MNESVHLRIHVKSVFSFSFLCWSPDSRLLAAGGHPGWVYLWEAGEKRPFARVDHHHQRSLQDLRWSPQGTHIASSDLDGHLCVWDARIHEIQYQYHYDVVDDNVQTKCLFAWSPTGELLAHSGYLQDTQYIQIVRTSDWRLVHQWSIDNATVLEWSPDETVLATGTFFGEVRLWDVKERHLIESIPLLKYDGSSFHVLMSKLRWSPDGCALLFGSRRGPLVLWQREKRHAVVLYPEKHTVRSDDPRDRVAFLGDAVWSSPSQVHLLCKAWPSALQSDAISIETVFSPTMDDRRYMLHDMKWSPDRRLMAAVGHYYAPRSFQSSVGVLMVWSVSHGGA